MINTSVGRMEEKTSVRTILDKLFEEWKKGTEINVSFFEHSRNHNGKLMMRVCEHEDDGVNIWNLEISEEGVFAYSIDDGAS